MTTRAHRQQPDSTESGLSASGPRGAGRDCVAALALTLLTIVAIAWIVGNVVPRFSSPPFAWPMPYALDYSVATHAASCPAGGPADVDAVPPRSL